ncbi:probable steroid-binding protein 3 [Drosophila mauritiana]|uniref:Probable steroid-binding protein 3 n=1 Tax=Drosophila mauritiana TaxID=7226 RepID=A0A6P8KJH4_DROMA|nr:probable steroid-binding protein 3 [Drosophila mauritiana]
MADSSKGMEHPTSWYCRFYNSVREAPINVPLLIISCVLFYKLGFLVRRLSGEEPHFSDDNDQEVDLPPLRQDFTVRELRKYDGTRADGRILVAIIFNIYDVSRSVHYYGRNGVNPNYAGRDISRILINSPEYLNDSEDFDDLSDLSSNQMNTLREWEQQYKQKYPFVGKLREKLQINDTDEEDLELQQADPVVD